MTNLTVQLSRELIEKGLYKYRGLNFSLKDVGVKDPSDLEMMQAWGEVVSEGLVAINPDAKNGKRLMVTPLGRDHLEKANHLIR